LYYRYASFSGGGLYGRHNFDPLFYGMSDWGTWYQGEILGNWIAGNSNLNSHQVRLNLAADGDISLNIIYYHFVLASRTQDLVSKPATPLTSKTLADEVNLLFSFKLTNCWSIAGAPSRLMFRSVLLGRFPAVARFGFNRRYGRAGASKIRGWPPN
jgi:hypothetical protein